MKKILLFGTILLVFALSGCSEWFGRTDDSNMTNPEINIPEDISIEANSDFNLLDGVHCYDGDDGAIEVEITGHFDITTPGEYNVKYSCQDEAGTSVTGNRTITVWDYVFANGLYNYRFGDVETRLEFLSQAESYLMERQLGGINLWTSASYMAFSDRFEPGLPEYVSVLGFDIYHGTMSEDDTTVNFINGYQGFEGEYTYRSTLPTGLQTYNQYMFDTSVERDVLEHVYGSLYTYATNEEKTGYKIVPSMASELPIPVNSELSDFNEVLSYTWKIPLRDDLEWYLHPDAPEEIKNSSNTDISAEDFILSYKLALDNHWFRAVSGGGDFLCSVNGIDGAQEYIDGEGSWEDVGFKATTDENGNEFIEVTYINRQSLWDVQYYFSSFIHTPIHRELYEYQNERDEIYGDDYTKVGYHGPFYIEEDISGQSIHLKENPNYHNQDEYFLDGIMYQYVDTESEIFDLFIQGYFDATPMPTSITSESYDCCVDKRAIPSPTTMRMNINRLGTVEAQQEQFPGSSHVPEPILGYDDFVLAMFHALDREHLAEDVLNNSVLPQMYYFSDGYIIDPSYGISYRETEQGISVGEGLNPGTYGYNPTKAVDLFNSTIDQMIQDGTIVPGTSNDFTVIDLELIIYSESEMWTLAATYMEEQYELLFQNNEHYISINIDVVEKDFPEIYYDHQMVGNFDLGVGGISGSLLCPLCYQDIFSSDNRSGFTLNWGIDTSVPEIKIDYYDHEGVLRHEIFSYDAIASLTDYEKLLYQGGEFTKPSVEIVETTDSSFSFKVNEGNHPPVTNITYTIQEIDYETYDGVDLVGYIDVPYTDETVTISGLDYYVDSMNELGERVEQGDYIIILEYEFEDSLYDDYEQNEQWVSTMPLYTFVEIASLTSSTFDFDISVYGERGATHYEVYESGNDGIYHLAQTVNATEFTGIHIQDLNPNTWYVIKLHFDTDEITYLRFRTYSE